MFSTKDSGVLFDEKEDRDLIALMNETNDFEELETLTRMARARLRSRNTSGKGMSSSEATSRLRRALSFSLGS